MKRWLLLSMVCVLALAACASGPPRRISEPAASIQQLTVRADGSWSIELRLQNYSSVPMRFDSVDLALRAADRDAGALRGQPGISIGPESADVITLALAPAAEARIAMANALADGRGIDYALTGTIRAAPADRGNPRDYDVKRSSRLSPVPGLPGVLR